MEAMPHLVLFDLGGTLLWLDKPLVLWRVLRERGLERPWEQVDRAWLRADRFFMAHRPRMWHVGTELRDRAILGHVLRELGVGVDAETARQALVGSSHWLPFPDALPALRTLRARGVRTGLITNWDPSARQLLAGWQLAAYLDPVVISSEVGWEKPDPRIFQLALEWAGVPPHQALYVGDNYWDDVLGARSAGLEAVLLDRSPESWEAPRDCPVVTDLAALATRATPVPV